MRTDNPNTPRRPRSTKVARSPYYCPWTGDWLFLPSDTAHNTMATTQGPDGQSMSPENYYVATGYQSLAMVRHDAEIMAKLRAHPEGERWAGPAPAAKVMATVAADGNAK